MIKSVTVTNYLGESLLLELSNPWEVGIAITKIEGLGPVKASINSTEISSGDGARFNSARIGTRNIVFTFRLLEAPTVEDSRQKTYKYFPIKTNVTLLFETDNRLCQITGYVESNKPNIFSEEEDTQISIICPNPYFISMENGGMNTVIFFGSEPTFEFPFSNESLIDPLIIFGNIKLRQEEVVLYDGDSQVGFTIKMHALGEVRQITIYNTKTRESMKIDTDILNEITGSGIIAGDEITISTIKGDKHITLLRDGEETNILNTLGKDVDWFQLSKGDNRFAYICEYGAENLEFSIEHQTLYEGV